MDLSDSTTQATIGVAILSGLAAFLLYQPTGFVRWLQKKNYQYEVTTALYMLTPTEKFIFNSVLFLTLSLLTIASIVYLPDHIACQCEKAYYYFFGDAARVSTRHAAETLYETATRAGDAVLDAVTGWAQTAQAVMNRTTADAAQEAASQAAKTVAQAAGH